MLSFSLCCSFGRCHGPRSLPASELAQRLSRLEQRRLPCARTAAGMISLLPSLPPSSMPALQGQGGLCPGPSSPASSCPACAAAAALCSRRAQGLRCRRPPRLSALPGIDCWRRLRPRAPVCGCPPWCEEGYWLGSVSLPGSLNPFLRAKEGGAGRGPAAPAGGVAFCPSTRGGILAERRDAALRFPSLGARSGSPVALCLSLRATAGCAGGGRLAGFGPAPGAPRRPPRRGLFRLATPAAPAGKGLPPRPP